ncbi:hypothetical protein FIBSPDRAFT_935376 [Athelia psychrophila]|uniref:Uncharacterized protein n=1 Tax=Athelia psychrophila TaxID=1759441 RepID=A0A166DWC2_9AGAM|nr:hypothetical protein FIBSPDRAFT_935376 [Fibularhizoctonia sp. CBS 109695]
MFDDHSAVYLAKQAQISAYASVACLSAFIFDCILSVEEEVNMHQRGRFGKPIITYCLARALTSLLFFFRVRAVFSRSPKAKFAFSVLWVLTTVAMPLVWNFYQFKCTDTEHSGTICKQSTWHSLVFFLIVIINDTLVFVYVSRELSSNSVTGKCNLRTLSTGDGLHYVSKLLLRTGQLYYSATASLIIIATIALLREVPFYIIFLAMHQTISSVLACRVFRMVLLCERELGPNNREIQTAEVEAMLAAAMARDEVTHAV